MPANIHPFLISCVHAFSSVVIPFHPMEIEQYSSVLVFLHNHNSFIRVFFPNRGSSLLQNNLMPQNSHGRPLWISNYFVYWLYQKLIVLLLCAALGLGFVFILLIGCGDERLSLVIIPVYVLGEHVPRHYLLVVLYLEGRTSLSPFTIVKLRGAWSGLLMIYSKPCFGGFNACSSWKMAQVLSILSGFTLLGYM